MTESPTRLREIWESKPALREIYYDFYRRILDQLVPGRTLEIGAGPGNFKLRVPAAISTDIAYAPWLDVICDAQQIPFADSTFSNLVMIDALHHVERPVRTLKEASRLLQPGGRFVLVEPAMTPVSWVVCRLFHEEPIDLRADPLVDGPISPDRSRWDANIAIPSLLVGRYRAEVEKVVPELHLFRTDLFSFLGYPLSGGWATWSILPAGIVRRLVDYEWDCRGALGNLMAFKLLIVYQKM